MLKNVYYLHRPSKAENLIYPKLADDKISICMMRTYKHSSVYFSSYPAYPIRMKASRIIKGMNPNEY